MTATQWIGLAIQVSLIAIVFSVGLNTHRGDIVSLLRQPGLLTRSLLAMYVIVPVSAALLVAGFDLEGPVAFALIALAVSPVPPILPNKEVKAGASASYAVSLLAISAIVAIAVIPASVELLGKAFRREVHVPAAAIIRTVAVTVLAPLVMGAIVRQLAPGVAARISRPCAIVGNVLLVVACVPVLIVAWHQFVELAGHLTLVAAVLIALVGLAVGHVLGGPNPADRTALALSTATRHPGIAIAVTGAVGPHDKTVVMAVLLVFVVGFIVTIPYVARRKRVHAQGNP